MSPDPPSSGPEMRTFICTVVFVDLVDYSEQPVTHQGTLKTHLNELIGRSVAHVAEAERLALDTGDGAALCFFGDPEDALFAAANLRDALAADPGPVGARVRIGINVGPGRLVRDLNGNRNVIGDGINVAQRVMSFAAPGQILVSRSYYEIVSHISAEYSRLFQYVGIHRDKHIREHEVYEVYVAPPSGTTEAEPSAVPEAASGVSRPASAFPGELLARLTEALAEHLGPVATLVVRRAAQRARDARGLVDAVAGSLTGAARERFLGRVADTTVASSTAPGPAAPAAAAAERRGPAPITPALIARVEDRLAHHLGPIARVLVAQAARDATDVARLIDRLATYITDSAARAAFIQSARED